MQLLSHRVASRSWPSESIHTQQLPNYRKCAVSHVVHTRQRFPRLSNPPPNRSLGSSIVFDSRQNVRGSARPTASSEETHTEEQPDAITVTLVGELLLSCGNGLVASASVLGENQKLAENSWARAGCALANAGRALMCTGVFNRVNGDWDEHLDIAADELATGITLNRTREPAFGTVRSDCRRPAQQIIDRRTNYPMGIFGHFRSFVCHVSSMGPLCSPSNSM
jgi:hypothetical protein